jgi:site-specific recombinase XerD
VDALEAERQRLVSDSPPFSDTVTSDRPTLSEVDPGRRHLTVGALAIATTAPFDDAYQAAQDYARAARAANTVRAYSSDWRDFLSWCQTKQLAPLPAEPQAIVWYLGHLAQLGRKPATIERRLTAIAQAHKQLGYDAPTSSTAVRNVLAGIKRTHGTVQDAKAAALVDDVRAMIEQAGDGPHGLRDRALILVGFAGAFRRDELAHIALEDLEWTRAGVVVLLRHSKTDQEGRGRKVGIPFGQHAETCPVRALRTWLKVAEISSGPAFRKVDRWGKVGTHALCDRAVALIVKRLAAAAGLDASRYGGHSLRAGLATAAAIAGVDERKIMAQTGHKSVEMVRRYIRDADLFRDNAAGQVGL